MLFVLRFVVVNTKVVLDPNMFEASNKKKQKKKKKKRTRQKKEMCCHLHVANIVITSWFLFSRAFGCDHRLSIVIVFVCFLFCFFFFSLLCFFVV